MNREDVKRRIQAALDLAWHPNTPEHEAKAALDAAGRLADAYAIDELEMEMFKPRSEWREPEWRVITLYSDQLKDYDIKQQFATLLQQLARHNRCVVSPYYNEVAWNQRRVLGFASDLDMLEMCFLRVSLHMVSHLEPEVDPSENWEIALVRLKEAGYGWYKIHAKLKAAGLKDYPYTDLIWRNNNLDPANRKIGVRFTAVYKDYCKRNGKPQVKDNPTVYRRDFIMGYVQAVALRVREWAKLREGDSTASGVSNSQAVALRDLFDRVKEAFYQAYPDLRPHPDGCDCDRCHLCRDPKCKRQRCINYQAELRKPVRYSAPRQVASSAMAASAGRAAGMTVNLTGSEVGNKRRELR